MLVVVGGDADVLIIEFQREGMLGLAQTTVTAVESHHLHQIVGKGFLLCFRVLLMQEIVVDCLLYTSQSCKVYVKPEEGAAYYVINKVSGKLEL